MPLALQILNEVADRLGWEQIDTIESAHMSNETRKLLRLLNRILSTLGGLDEWPMLRGSGTLQLVADEISDVTSGSEQYVTATKNSPLVTIDNMALDATYIGRAIKIQTCEYVFRIVDVTGTTQLELNRSWFEDSITASDEATFHIAMDQYVLPVDFDRPIDDFSSFLAPYEINPVDPSEFQERRRRRSGMLIDQPKVFTIYGLNEAQTAMVIHFDPYPDEVTILDFPYIKIHPEIDSDNDKILYPKRVIEVIIEMMLQLAYRDYEDDDRMQVALTEMIMKYNQSVGKSTATDRRKIMRPNKDTRINIYRAYRAGGRNIDWGDTFDRAGNVGFF
jgi:hypothetical protein